jgi:hypothetical protein
MPNGEKPGVSVTLTRNLAAQPITGKVVRAIESDPPVTRRTAQKNMANGLENMVNGLDADRKNHNPDQMPAR